MDAEKILNLPASTSTSVHRTMLEDQKKNAMHTKNVGDKNSIGSFEHSDSHRKCSKEKVDKNELGNTSPKARTTKKVGKIMDKMKAN